MDIIRTHCLHCGETPQENDGTTTVIAALDSDGNTLAHLVLFAHRDGYMITDESNYRAVFQKCVCCVDCGKILVERFWRKAVTLRYPAKVMS